MMKLEDKDLLQLRRLSTVPRWTIIPTIQKQNVAEHTFHVVWIATWVAQFTHPVDPPALMYYAMRHDQDEALSGDLPSTFKRKLNEHYGSAFERPMFHKRPGSGHIKSVVKIADYLEAILFLKEEEWLGNCSLKNVLEDAARQGELVWKTFEWTEGPIKPDFMTFVDKFIQILSPDKHPDL